MTSRKRVLLADGSEEFRWLIWKSAANHDFSPSQPSAVAAMFYYVCKNRLPICC